MWGKPISEITETPTYFTALNGELWTTYHYYNAEIQLQHLQELKAKHGCRCTYIVTGLNPSFKVGERCRISGEGAEEFTISRISTFSAYRFYIEADGEIESVHKLIKLSGVK